jgi:hypothetical protein
MNKRLRMWMIDTEIRHQQFRRTDKASIKKFYKDKGVDAVPRWGTYHKSNLSLYLQYLMVSPKVTRAVGQMGHNASKSSRDRFLIGRLAF